MIKPLRKLNFSDATQQQFADSVSSVIGDISGRQIVDGQLIEDVVLVSGTAKQVAHGLDRAWRGYLVAKKSANAQVWDSASTDEKKFVKLNCSANVTVSLWVF